MAMQTQKFIVYVNGSMQVEAHTYKEAEEIAEEVLHELQMIEVNERVGMFDTMLDVREGETETEAGIILTAQEGVRELANHGVFESKWYDGIVNMFHRIFYLPTRIMNKLKG
jgi:hypothetical protein